jgi:hypothetical protein
MRGGGRVYHVGNSASGPFEHIRELLGFQKGAPRKSRRVRRHVGWILEFDLGRSPPTKILYLEPHHPIVSLMDV